MTSPIQIPYLRDLPIHEGAGLQQAGGEDQMSQLAKLLMLKGHLALEQEKFQSAEQERKQKKQTLAGLSQTLSGLFQGAQTPDQLQSATAASIGPLAGAGETSGAAAAIHDLPGLQKQTQMSATQRALGTVMQEVQGFDLRDSRQQARAVGMISAIDTNAAKSFAESLRALQGRHTFHQDGAGRWWIGDTETGEMKPGPLGTPTAKGNTITSQEARTTAQIGAQALANVLHIVESDPTALHVPVGYAGVSNMKASGGVLGAIGGLVEPLAQTQLTPHQQMVMRYRDQFIETYMALITGKRGAGSPTLLNLARNAFFPLANQEDPQVQASALSSIRFALSKMQDLAAGRNADLTGLPGFAEATREGLGLPPEGAAAPQPATAPQVPLSPADLLKGVPPR